MRTPFERDTDNAERERVAMSRISSLMGGASRTARQTVAAVVRAEHSVDFDDPLDVRSDIGQIDWSEVRRQGFSSAEVKRLRLTESQPEQGTVRLSKEDVDRIREWAKGKKRIERPIGSHWHKSPGPMMDGGAEYMVFLVEHEWEKAFDGATDFADGEWHAPFDRCAFEFQVSGRRFIVLVDNSRPVGCLMHIADKSWTFGADEEMQGSGNGDPVSELYDRLVSIARAMCIALDAQVVVTEVVRAPYRLNDSREKQGKPPINDYHTVNLARRSRVSPLPDEFADHNDNAKWHPRLHFRRGHWRHLQNHKTWVRWTLVGDPDLGFIDKHYRA